MAGVHVKIRDYERFKPKWAKKILGLDTSGVTIERLPLPRMLDVDPKALFQAIQAHRAHFGRGGRPVGTLNDRVAIGPVATAAGEHLLRDGGIVCQGGKPAPTRRALTMIHALDHIVVAAGSLEAAVADYEVLLGRRADRPARSGGAGARLRSSSPICGSSWPPRRPALATACPLSPSRSPISARRKQLLERRALRPTKSR